MSKYTGVTMPTPKHNAKPLTEREKELLAAFYLGQNNGLAKGYKYLDASEAKFDSVTEAIEKLGAITLHAHERTEELRKELGIKQKPIRLELHAALGKVAYHIDEEEE